MTTNKTIIYSVPTISLANSTFAQVKAIYENESFPGFYDGRPLKDCININIYLNTAEVKMDDHDFFKGLTEGGSLSVTLHSYVKEMDSFKNSSNFFRLLKVFSPLICSFHDESQMLLKGFQTSYSPPRGLFC